MLVRSHSRCDLTDVWHESTVISRGGKASGKNWAYLNLLDVGEEQPNKVEEAKLIELQNWCKFKVYDEVEDAGQIRMSTRWVIT